MKRKIVTLTIALCVLLAGSAGAQEMPRVQFEAGAGAAAGYNNAWGAYGGADIMAKACINDMLDLRLDMEALSSGALMAGLSAQPGIGLGAGTIYLDGRILLRASGNIRDYVSAAGLGYRRCHFDIQLGMFSRTLWDASTSYHSEEGKVGEPFSMLYRVQFSIKGTDAPWNIHGGLSDFTSYEFERFWSPIFNVGGHCRLGERLRIYADVDVKPSGMFHLTAAFYGLTAHTGLIYRF